MADYIVCGRGENPNPIERGEVIAPTARHLTYVASDARNVSLDVLLDSPIPFEAQVRPWGSSSRRRNPIQRPFRRADGTMDPGDSTIPGMQELWAQIDALEARYQAETDTYKQYRLHHVLIDLQRQQYELRDTINPPIAHSAVASPTLNFESHVDFSADSSYWISEEEWHRKLAASYNPRLSRRLEDYETRVTREGTQVKWVVRQQKFDWENPKHVRALMENYDLLEIQDGNRPDTQGYALLQDFQLYRQKANISPMRDYILERRLAHASYGEIQVEVAEKWGVDYNNSYLCRVLTQELPQAIARAATVSRLIDTTPADQCKVCTKCGRTLPRHRIFFGVRCDEPDGFHTSCRDCNILATNGKRRDKRYKDNTRQVKE